LLKADRLLVDNIATGILLEMNDKDSYDSYMEHREKEKLLNKSVIEFIDLFLEKV
jgi:hypothetical protein